MPTKKTNPKAKPKTKVKAIAKTKTQVQKKDEPKIQTISAEIEKASAKAKLQADKAGEPYVQVLGMDLDPANPTFGAFTLDWNDAFISELRALGFNGDSAEEIIDQWFKSICSHVLKDTYADFEAARPGNGRRRLDKNRVEVH